MLREACAFVWLDAVRRCHLNTAQSRDESKTPAAPGRCAGWEDLRVGPFAEPKIRLDALPLIAFVARPARASLRTKKRSFSSRRAGSSTGAVGLVSGRANLEISADHVVTGG